jgi:uncharacterized protein
MATERTYHDPLHGAITLNQNDRAEALLIALIDTPAFQRLRRLRQLGPASLTFQGGEGSRFTHSLGVMAITRRAIDRLCQSTPQLLPHRALVLVAALLHDIGHGPFSHTGEEVFRTHHEAWTCKILNESAPIQILLDRFDPTLRSQLVQIYEKKHPIPCLWQLISSQLDCDRLDYLMRDSYMTGVSYGHLDLDRILLALQVDPVTQQLVVARKGLAAIEHYLVVRSFMYAQVYNHGKNIAATWVLDRAITRARDLLALGETLPIDDTAKAWMNAAQEPIELAHYLAGDDTVFQYHLQRWQTHSDPILSDLCRRWCDRDLFKAQEVSHLTPEQQQDLFHQTQIKTEALGLDPRYYTGIRFARNKGYTLYQKGISLRDSHGLTEINDLSPLVQTLTKTQARAWVVSVRSVFA